jgi:hypothetical protein
MYDVNEYRICWFSRFGFPGEKSLCNVCIFHCIFFCSFIENMFAVKYCTRLKSTFGIRAIIGFRGMPLWSGVWLGTVISLVTVGDLRY